MSNTADCGYANFAHGFCYVDNTPFYGRSWWSKTKHNGADSCAVVEGHEGKSNIDTKCTNAIDVEVLCEIPAIQNEGNQTNQNVLHKNEQ